MKAENQKERMVEDDGQNSQPIDTSRRLFSKRGVAASVIMTLANRSAWANYCVASGFQSFATAARLGQNLSHGAFTPPSGSGWKNSAGWLSQVTSIPGTAWPNPYIPTRLKSNGKYEVLNPSTGVWSGSYQATASEIAKGFVSSLLNVSDTRTIYTVLNGNLVADKTLIFQIASAFNSMISTAAIPFPNLTGEVFIINGVPMSDYEIFYSSCI